MPDINGSQRGMSWPVAAGGCGVQQAKLREHLVSPRINRTGVGDDDPTVIEPVELI